MYILYVKPLNISFIVNYRNFDSLKMGIFCILASSYFTGIHVNFCLL